MNTRFIYTDITVKIRDQAVGLSKLNLDELFVSGSAFINKLSAVEINATQITTGKISGERLDIQGLVSYEALSTELQPIFDVTGNKTYINGGMVSANTIKANSIDLLSGITVKGPDNTVTFAIAEDGNVTINGFLQSGNYDDGKKTGYSIGTNGKAILNEATVRGRVELPNAGMTNDYDMSQVDGRNIMPNSKGPFTVDAKEVAYAYKMIPCEMELNQTYTVSADVEVVEGDVSEITVYAYPGGTQGHITIPPSGRISYTFTKTSEDTVNVLLYAGKAGATHNNRVSFSNVKIEKGSQATEWTPAPEDDINPVRMWAGTSYELRDSAPFRVLQNGDVYATNARLTGLLYGSVDSGWVEINEKNFRIVNDTVNPEVEYVKFGVDDGKINTNLILGTETDARLRYMNDKRTLEMTNTSLNISNPGVTLKMSNNSSWLEGIIIESNQPGHTNNLRLGYSSNASYPNTLLITSGGGKGGGFGDINLRRQDDTEDIDIRVHGSVKVRESIKSTRHTIEMRSISDGWGFYAG